MIDALTPSTLRPAREAAGLSRTELAEMCGVHVTTIHRIERGEVDPRLSDTWAPIVRAVQAAGKRAKKRSTKGE